MADFLGPGNRWPYVSMVTCQVSCRISSWSTFGCAPALIATDANVWLRSWKTTPSSFARLAHVLSAVTVHTVPRPSLRRREDELRLERSMQQPLA
jgi:hypothetical protein